MEPKSREPWELPWLVIDRITRAITRERLEKGPSDERDRILAAVIRERRKVERAGWFN